MYDDYDDDDDDDDYNDDDDGDAKIAMIMHAYFSNIDKNDIQNEYDMLMMPYVDDTNDK